MHICFPFHQSTVLKGCLNSAFLISPLEKAPTSHFRRHNRREEKKLAHMCIRAASK